MGGHVDLKVLAWLEAPIVAIYLFILFAYIWRAWFGPQPKYQPYRIYRVLLLIEAQSKTLERIEELVKGSYFSSGADRAQFLRRLIKRVPAQLLLDGVVDCGPPTTKLSYLHSLACHVFKKTIKKARIKLQVLNIPGRIDRAKINPNNARAEAAFLSIVFVALDDPSCTSPNPMHALEALSKLPADDNTYLWFTYSPHAGDELSLVDSRKVFETAKEVELWREPSGFRKLFAV